MIDRRRFVTRLPALPAGAAAAGLLVSQTGCVSFRYLEGRDDGDRLIVDRTGFAGFPDVLVETPRLPKPVYLRELDTGGFSAVLVECTHRGCQPEPEGDRLVCPCHGSQFSFAGDVLRGPAELPLLRFPVTREGELLVIWLSGRPGA